MDTDISRVEASLSWANKMVDTDLPISEVPRLFIKLLLQPVSQTYAAY